MTLVVLVYDAIFHLLIYGDFCKDFSMHLVLKRNEKETLINIGQYYLPSGFINLNIAQTEVFYSVNLNYFSNFICNLWHHSTYWCSRTLTSSPLNRKSNCTVTQMTPLFYKPFMSRFWSLLAILLRRDLK